MSDIDIIRTRIESRIKVLSRPEGKHVYDRGGIHADIDRCGECGRLHELRNLLDWFEGTEDVSSTTSTTEVP